MYVPYKYAFNLCYVQLEHNKRRILLFFIFCVMMLLSADVNAESSNERTGLIFGLTGGYASGFNKESDIKLPFFPGRYKVVIRILVPLLVMIMAFMIRCQLVLKLILTIHLAFIN